MNKDEWNNLDHEQSVKIIKQYLENSDYVAIDLAETAFQDLPMNLRRYIQLKE